MSERHATVQKKNSRRVSAKKAPYNSSTQKRSYGKDFMGMHLETPTVRIVRDKFFPILNGMEGIIRGEEDWEGRHFYRIVATNFGPKMKTPQGNEKATFVWQPNDWRRVEREAFVFI